GSNRGGAAGLYRWTTYPERLQAAGVSWRIYQDPRENWNALLAPWESFESYTKAKPGDPLFDNAMTRWTLAAMAEHVQADTLPQVSWIVPSPVWSEHPAGSSPLQGAAYTQRVLDILVSNPEVWSRTVFIVTFDENDRFFDHVPPPAPPSLAGTGHTLGGSTLADADMAGLYYRDAIDGPVATRPYGLGPRVPMYIVSPWSRGGWVCSQLFDHTSTIRFLEARFGVQEPNISAWHRAVSGDLTSCFDFTRPNRNALPALPDMSSVKGEPLAIDLPPARPPKNPRLPSQDFGVRFSRALPYRLSVHATQNSETGELELELENKGTWGAVFHVYDRQRLDERPHRYTVEADKTLATAWSTRERAGSYDLHILGPNGSLWRLTGRIPQQRRDVALPEVRLRLHPDQQSIALEAWNTGDKPCTIATTPNAYRSDPAFTHTLMPETALTTTAWPLQGSGFWYDFSVTCAELPDWSRRFAGRLETGKHGISDPALGGFTDKC
ncbi:MAG: hypothetical protein RL701_4515, partial [Pseudomonadota bacterium]